MTCNQDYPIFNFNLIPSFTLSEHMNYFRPLSDTDLFVDPIHNLLSFQYCKARTSGGIKIKLATIPSEIYHIYVTGQLIIGDYVHMTIENHGPIINLDKPKKWKMGSNEVKTLCFTALTHQTILSFTTNKSCFIDNSPYEFLLSQLDIIPDTLSCQGYIKGTTGPTGITGPIGIIGPIGNEVIGNIGPIGITGPQGDKGEEGSTGSEGLIGGVGSIGGIGPDGMQSSVRGPAGDPGIQGVMGAIGPIGFEGISGSKGIQGNQGIPAYRIGDNVIIDQFQLFWTRGGPIIGINTATFEKISNLIILRLSGFACVGSIGFDFSCLNSTSLDNTIRTLEFRNSYFPAIVQVGTTVDNLVTRNVTIEIGPAIIIIYSDINQNCEFDKSQIVFFPEQTFIYYKDDIDI